MDRSGRIGALVEDVNNYGVRGEVVRGASVISGVRMARGQDGEGGVTRSEGNVKIDVVIYHAAVVIPRRKEAAGLIISLWSQTRNRTSGSLDAILFIPSTPASRD